MGEKYYLFEMFDPFRVVMFNESYFLQTCNPFRIENPERIENQKALN
jgi:hypothetical protein